MSNQKTVYSYHPQTRVYVGEEVADECRIVPGDWHIPANATEIAPPDPRDGCVRVFGTHEWHYMPMAVA